MADDMPARLHVDPRWTAENDQCRDHPETCVAQCENGDGEACYAIGVGLEDREQAADARSMYGLACRAGSAIGCTNYGAGLLQTATDAEAPTAVCAARIFERTCAAGERVWGCGMWGMVLSVGNGVQRDPDLALEVLERACAQAEYFACDVLGLSHRQGRFGEPSIDAARQAYARGCRGGYQLSCESLTALGPP